MNITITGKELKATEAIKDYVANNLKVEKAINFIIDNSKMKK